MGPPVLFVWFWFFFAHSGARSLSLCNWGGRKKPTNKKKVSLGHTKATTSQAEEIVATGHAPMITHLYNAMRQHHRDPGLKSVALLDRLPSGFFFTCVFFRGGYEQAALEPLKNKKCIFLFVHTGFGLLLWPTHTHNSPSRLQKHKTKFSFVFKKMFGVNGYPK